MFWRVLVVQYVKILGVVKDGWGSKLAHTGRQEQLGSQSGNTRRQKKKSQFKTSKHEIKENKQNDQNI